MAENVFIVENKEVKVKGHEKLAKGEKKKIGSVIKIKVVVTGGSRVGRLGAIGKSPNSSIAETRCTPASSCVLRVSNPIFDKELVHYYSFVCRAQRYVRAISAKSLMSEILKRSDSGCCVIGDLNAGVFSFSKHILEIIRRRLCRRLGEKTRQGMALFMLYQEFSVTSGSTRVVSSDVIVPIKVRS